MNEEDIILAISGIGNPRPFIKYLKSFYAKVKTAIYPDHHDFNRKDLDYILNRFRSLEANRKYIITTEKDAVKFASNPYFPSELKPYIYYLPISVEFSNEGDKTPFISALIKSIENR